MENLASYFKTQLDSKRNDGQVRRSSSIVDFQPEKIEKKIIVPKPEPIDDKKIEFNDHLNDDHIDELRETKLTQVANRDRKAANMARQFRERIVKQLADR